MPDRLVCSACGHPIAGDHSAGTWLELGLAWHKRCEARVAWSEVQRLRALAEAAQQREREAVRDYLNRRAQANLDRGEAMAAAALMTAGGMVLIGKHMEREERPCQP